MLPVSVGRDWNDWTLVQSGNGVVSVTDGVLSVSDPDTTSSSHARKRFALKPGETIEVIVMGKLISGSGDTAPGIAIDYPANTMLKNRVQLDSSEWKEYRLSYTAPITNTTETAYAQVVIGSWSSLTGEAKYAHPRVIIHNPVFGAPRVVAACLLRIQSGSPPTLSFTGSWVRAGIKSVSYDSGNKVIRVGIEKHAQDNGVGPILSVCPTPELPRTITTRAGSYDYNTGEVLIEFIDTTNGSLVDPATVNGFVWFMALG